MTQSQETPTLEWEEEGEGLDPGRAAQLLERTEDAARRQLDASSPQLSLLTGLVLLAAYGILWLSVRGQHPYRGPTPGAVVGVLGLMALLVIVDAVVIDRARHGVSGLSSRRRRMLGAAVLAGYLGVLLIEAALAHDGFGAGVAFGVVAAVAPLLVVGVAAIGASAVETNWPRFGLGLALVGAAAGSAFAGPVGAWGIAGLSSCAAFTALALAQRGLRSR